MLDISKAAMLRVADMSHHIDAKLADAGVVSSGEMLYARTAKLSEETGEVIQSVIGILGHNPRKGVTHTEKQLIDELCDVITCGMGALYHVVQDGDETAIHIMSHIRNTHQRMFDGTQEPQDAPS